MYEPDQRHAELIIKGCQLNDESKHVCTPGTKQDAPQHDDEDELVGRDATVYRALAARANYLAQDRSDIVHATKELTRKMSAPCNGDWRALKRLARYLMKRPRVVTLYKYQTCNKFIDTWVDTDYAGCKRTRKSTSGGVIMLGEHVIKSWSTTQHVIALSSGEAEFYGIARGGSLAPGIRSVMNDLDMKGQIRISTDASAAKGIASRRGLGKVRHTEVNHLWIQDKVASSEIMLCKVKGTVNKADALTKHVTSDELMRHMNDTGIKIVDGRHQIAPAVAQDEVGVIK